MASDLRIDALESEMRVLVTMDLGKLWDRYLGEFLGEWERLNRQGLGADAVAAEMDAFLEALSDKPMQDLARTGSSVSYNQGRSAEILTAGDDGRAEFVVRSEILDSKTCEACANLDSMIVEVGTPGYFEFLPPAKCLGGDRCRGFYVAIGKAA